MTNFKNKHFLKLLDFTPAEIQQLLDLSADLKAKKKAGIPHTMCEGKNIVRLFDKDSTRTRCAFDVAGADLGMSDLPGTQRLPDGQEGVYQGYRPGAGPDV